MQTKREHTHDASILPELPSSDLASFTDAQGHRCEVCSQLFKIRKTLSRHTCVRKGVADAKTGTMVKILTQTKNAAVPPATEHKSQPDRLSSVLLVTRPSLPPGLKRLRCGGRELRICLLFQVRGR